jgi:signal transduction histidine kinase
MGIARSVPENSLRNDVIGESGLPFAQLFLECDNSGRVLWMSDKARERLGETVDLAEAFPELPALRRYLEECRASQTLAGVLHRKQKPPVRVRLSCVLRSAGRVVLSAEVRERTWDRLEAASNQLIAMQNRVLRNYFRLLRMQQALDSRLNRGRRNPGAMISAQLERERARMARELHTGAGQLLSAINVHVELIERKAPDLPAEIRRYLERIANLAREAGAEVRAVSHRHHPLDWQALGLLEALRKLWNESGIPERFQASLNLPPALIAEPSQPVRVAVYRIAQESLSNAIHHADATRLSLSLDDAEGRIRIRIEDNGRGFDANRLSNSAGIGLRTIRDQVHNLDGKLEIVSGPNGTKLEAVIPLEPGNE